MRIQNKLFNLHNFTFPFKYLTGPSSALNRRASTGPDTRRSVIHGPTHGRPGPRPGRRQRALIPGAASLTAPRTAALLSPTVPDRGAQVISLSCPRHGLLSPTVPDRGAQDFLSLRIQILNRQRINKIDYYKVGVFVRFVSLMWDVRFSNQL